MSENEEWQNPTGQEPAGKRQRPRFQRAERISNAPSREQAFRPQGFETQNGSRDNGYQGRSSYSNQGGGYSKGGYNNRGGYGQGGYQRHENGYQSRGGYGNQGGYQNREGGYQSREGGYQDRPQSQNRPRPQGGYQNHNSQGGYQNRGNQGGYQGGYQSGYQGRPSQGGPRTQGGYNRQGGYNNSNRQGGYNNNRQGGYNQKRKGNYNPNDKYSLKKQIEYKEYLEDPNAPIRLNKFLANAGVCSRREADEYIQAGVVKVNGEIVTELGTKVQRTDEIHFHDQLVSLEKKVYVILNKPKDYVTTSDDPQARKTVLDLVKNCCKERIYPVGRLDRNTSGVLLFTNDGELATKLSHPKYMKKKIYHVHLDKNCTINDMKALAEGIELEDGEIHADAISFASDTDRKQVGIEIHSGKNRIVRRMFEHLGYKVLKLDRVMFAGLTKKGLKRGDWRFLTEQEVAMLHMNTQD